MALRKSMEEEIVVAGKREEWLQKCETALNLAGFKEVKLNNTLFQIEADYKKGTIYGSILITLIPQGENTEMKMKSTANVDNIFALIKSPNKAILTKFKEALR